jgi:hypothetical protein
VSNLISIVLVSAVMAGLSINPSQAQLVTFEQTPAGGTPVDDTVLTAPYALTGGGTVRFYFDNNNNNAYDSGTDTDPRFEATGAEGSPVSGFRATQSPADDTPRALPGLAEQLGNWFIRKFGDVDGPTPNPFVFIADYDTTGTIQQLSGEIWDIDSGSATDTEQWRVDVLNSSGSILATTTSPLGILQTDPASLDGRPWLFSFADLPDGVDKVRLTFIGGKQSGVGLAFNNFSPTIAIPEPTALPAVISVLILIAVRHQRRDADKSAR